MNTILAVVHVMQRMQACMHAFELFYLLCCAFPVPAGERERVLGVLLQPRESPAGLVHAEHLLQLPRALRACERASEPSNAKQRQKQSGAKQFERR